jgi:uncharacterized alpha-E superfamily protein
VLSRIAESLYWIGRYVERADDTARILDVHVYAALTIEPDATARHLALLVVMGLRRPAGDVDLARLTYLLTFDEENASSVVGCVDGARANARGARESISAEMWECLNVTWHGLPSYVSGVGFAGPHAFFRYIRERAALFAGLADSTMSQDDGWRFLVLGRSIERADMTSRLLSSRLGVVDPHDWLTLLTSCSAYEAFLRRGRGDLTPQAVIEFLLLDRTFPRSILHALISAERCLSMLANDQPDDRPDEARRVLARARTRLEYEPFADVLGDLASRLRSVQDSCSAAGQAIANRWFRQSGLPSWTTGRALVR